MTRATVTTVTVLLLLAPCKTLAAQRARAAARPSRVAQPVPSTHEVATQLARIMSAEHAASLESSTSAATAGATSDAQQVFEATQHFVQKYVPTDSVVSVLARQLEHELGDGDLRALLTFYSSPSGKLFVAVQPRLMAAVQAEIARMMAPHQQEMQDSLTTLIKNAPK